MLQYLIYYLRPVMFAMAYYLYYWADKRIANYPGFLLMQALFRKVEKLLPCKVCKSTGQEKNERLLILMK